MTRTEPLPALDRLARGLRGLWLAALLATLGGCATTSGISNPRDPFEPFNRGIARFNDAVDNIVVKPVATAYREGVPPVLRTGVSNFFGNLSDVWSFINSVLQLKVQNSAENFMRVSVNTFFGLGGVIDIASDLDIQRHREDFGQTLGRWGVPAGPYLVLPFFGPSTVRDTAALPVDLKFDLVRQFDPASARYAMYTLRIIDTRSNLLRASSVLDEVALDKYSFTRDAYLQRRRTDISDGLSDTPTPPAGTAPQPGPQGTSGPATK